MMKMSFDVTAKKLFGVHYERLIRTLFLDLVIFWGLHIAGFRVEIAPFIRYLMSGAFSAGVMWQALPAGDNRANLENMFMLLFKKNVRFHKKSGVKKAGGGAGIIAVLAVLTAIAWGGIWFWKRKRSL